MFTRRSALVSTLLPLCLLALTASDAGAGGVIVTPPLAPPNDGSLVCRFANAGAKDVVISRRMFDDHGNSLGGITGAIEPKNVMTLTSFDDGARFCVVTLLKGAKKNIRVSLEVRNGAGELVTAVTGQ